MARKGETQIMILSVLSLFQAKKRKIIGHFESKESDNYKTFVRVASFLRDDCRFHVAVGSVGLIATGRSVRFPVSAQDKDDSSNSTSSTTSSSSSSNNNNTATTTTTSNDNHNDDDDIHSNVMIMMIITLEVIVIKTIMRTTTLKDTIQDSLQSFNCTANFLPLTWLRRNHVQHIVRLSHAIFHVPFGVKGQLCYRF